MSEKIFSKENNIFVRPIEARFFQIPLEIPPNRLREIVAKSNGAADISGYEDSPLIAFFLKDSNSVSLRKKIDKLLDLQIYVSRTDPFPNHSSNDFEYNFDETPNHKPCKITVIPKGKEPRFQFFEKYIYVGLYSLNGLPNIAFNYGFGSQISFSLKNDLIDKYTLSGNDEFTKLAPPLKHIVVVEDKS